MNAIVLRYVRHGRQCARTIDDIARLAHLPRRTVEQALQELADGGRHPIVACGAGVYLATTPEEVEDYAKRLQRRLVTQYMRIRGARRAAMAMRSPLTLWREF